MTTSRPPSVSGTPPEPSATGYRHELYPYSYPSEFAEGTLGFIQEALDGDEAVVVAVPQDKASLLRAQIADDAVVRYVDTTATAHHPGRLIGAWQAWIREHASDGRWCAGSASRPGTRLAAMPRPRNCAITSGC